MAAHAGGAGRGRSGWTRRSRRRRGCGPNAGGTRREGEGGGYFWCEPLAGAPLVRGGWLGPAPLARTHPASHRIPLSCSPYSLSPFTLSESLPPSPSPCHCPSQALRITFRRVYPLFHRHDTIELLEQAGQCCVTQVTLQCLHSSNPLHQVLVPFLFTLPS